jgi:hypothetical protein
MTSNINILSEGLAHYEGMESRYWSADVAGGFLCRPSQYAPWFPRRHFEQHGTYEGDEVVMGYPCRVYTADYAGARATIYVTDGDDAADHEGDIGVKDATTASETATSGDGEADADADKEGKTGEGGNDGKDGDDGIETGPNGEKGHTVSLHVNKHYRGQRVVKASFRSGNTLQVMEFTTFS